MVLLCGVLPLTMVDLPSLPDQPVGEEPAVEESPPLLAWPHHEAAVEAGQDLQAEQAEQPSEAGHCQGQPEHVWHYQV